MKHFEEILHTIGAIDVHLLEENAEWHFWSANFQTPVAKVQGYYLYLKYGCSSNANSKENLEHWKNYSNDKGYDLVVTPKSNFAGNLKKTQTRFGAKSSYTSTQFLKDYFLNGLKLKRINDRRIFYRS